MTKREIIDFLRDKNLTPSAMDPLIADLCGDGSEGDPGGNVLARIHQYASCLVSYLEAAENLERNGTIVAHPRTGTPMENPYLKVRTVTMADMRRCEPPSGVNELWEAILAQE